MKRTARTRQQPKTPPLAAHIGAQRGQQRPRKLPHLATPCLACAAISCTLAQEWRRGGVKSQLTFHKPKRRPRSRSLFQPHFCSSPSGFHASVPPYRPLPRKERRVIGIFDSGLGGLSVLAAIARALPRADLVYLADTAHVPYGPRDDAFIRGRVLSIGQLLVERGCTLIARSTVCPARSRCRPA